MKSAQTYFDIYGKHHQNRINKAIHWVCVPAIFWSIFALFWSMPTPAFFTYEVINWATILLVLVQVFYFRLSFSLGLGFLFINMAIIIFTQHMVVHAPVALWQLAIIVFVIAWIGQFIGHYIEGKKPSFFDDIRYLLIGPAWLVGMLYKKLHINY